MIIFVMNFLKYSLSYLIEIFDSQQILGNPNEINLLLKLIFLISNKHRRTSNFFGKLERIITYLLENSTNKISISKFKYDLINKRLLYFLIEKKNPQKIS